MTFLELLDGVEVLCQGGNPNVSGLQYDSRKIKPGDVFVAMRGESSDGNKFIDQAIASGAVAVVTVEAAVDAAVVLGSAPGAFGAPLIMPLAMLLTGLEGIGPATRVQVSPPQRKPSTQP